MPPRAAVGRDEEEKRASLRPLPAPSEADLPLGTALRGAGGGGWLLALRPVSPPSVAAWDEKIHRPQIRGALRTQREERG